MEKEEKIKYAVRVFSCLIKQSVSTSFSFPGGGLAWRNISSCIDSLEKLCKSELSRERIIDFCVCQIYTISRFGDGYMAKWNVSHSFGKKAIERFYHNTSIRKHYEDLWLKENGLSRSGLLAEFSDKSKHPLHKFIFPEYEEITKMRLLSTEAGFCICMQSTLLWTPFSPTCCSCNNRQRCQGITARKHGELYRIRIQEYNRKEE